MEAENYLSTGYGQWLALEARLEGRGRLGDVARIWQPSRLKGITVGRNYGTPFLAATQVFDQRPVPRKFLSLDRTDSSAERFTSDGTILVTCSGSVGRATLATKALEGILVSHDLLRIAPKQKRSWGWIYAYLRTSKVRAMLTSARYGHMIKHLEPSHLSTLPIPTPQTAILLDFHTDAKKVLRSRNQAFQLLERANELFEDAVGLPKSRLSSEIGFSIPVNLLTSGRRRFDGVFHSPQVRAIRAHFASKGFISKTIKDMGFDAWLPSRFRRIPAEDGVTLVGSADLFEINPALPKRIADIDFGDQTNGRVKSGWLLLARSGQTYGLNGTLAIANEFHEEKVISDDAMRIAPNADCEARVGFIYTALSHPLLGRPLVKALAYGSSIPHIDVLDVERLPVVRLGENIDNEIADLAEKGANLFAAADILENEMSAKAEHLLEDLLAGNWKSFVQLS